MPTLHIRLLGNFHLVYDDTLISTFVQPRLQALLAYLLLHRNSPQPRQQISYLFWPDSTEHQALTNLRQILHRMRRSLPAADEFVQINRKTIQWRLDATYTLDVANFEHALAQASAMAEEGNTASERAALESAVTHYGGDLLPVCYDEWIFPERERLHQTYLGALDRLIQLAEKQRDYATAIGHAERLLRKDPLHEITCRRLMRLHALNRDRTSALRVYHTCATFLERELGVEPNADTQEAYQRLLNMKAPAVVHNYPRAFSSDRPALVGRHREWKMLQTAWRYADAGNAALVLISGEAGIGKTRLAEAYLDWAAQQGITTARTRAYAAEGRLPYAPAIELLRSEPLYRQLSRLEDVWLVELARLLPELLEERGDIPKPAAITASWQRTRLFESLARALLSDSGLQLILLDDLQWCDPDTLEWLHYLLHHDAKAKLLVLGTARLEEVDQVHPLMSLILDLSTGEQLTEIGLSPLNAGETTKLAEQITDKKLDTKQAAWLYRYTEGNPLFVVETVRAQTNSDADGWRGEYSQSELAASLGSSSMPRPSQSSSTEMPHKIQAVIRARLGNLSACAQELVNLAAIIGRIFNLRVLVQASETDEETILCRLDELWRRRVLREKDNNVYEFSHDRIHEVAYAESNPVRRRTLHRRVAMALEKVYVSNLDAVSGQIAAHYEQAGLVKQAINYYQQAGEVARKTFSNADVASFLTRALTLVPRLPDTVERNRIELALLFDRNPALMASKGYGHTEVEQSLLRTLDLCRKLEIHDKTISAIAALWVCNNLKGNLEQQAKLAEDLKREIGDSADAELHTIAYFALAGTALFRGEFLAAQQYAEKGLSNCESGQLGSEDGSESGSLSNVFGLEPGIALIQGLALSLWLLGYPDQAQQRMEQGLELALNYGQPASVAAALGMGTLIHQWRGDIPLTVEQSEATIDYATEKELPQWVAHGQILRGWALGCQDRVETGITQIREGLEAWQAMGAGVSLTYYHLLLAEICSLGEKFDEGLHIVQKALKITHEGGETWMEAELYRRQGELLLMGMEDEKKAEACFLQALAIARLQQARSFELRAAISLSGLWQHQGKRSAAHNVLTEDYSWFSEGFNTADLRQARALQESIY